MAWIPQEFNVNEKDDYTVTVSLAEYRHLVECCTRYEILVKDQQRAAAAAGEISDNFIDEGVGEQWQ